MASISKRRRGGQCRRRLQNLAQYKALSPRSQASVDNVAHVITRMRDGVSLNSAAAEFGIDSRTVVNHGVSALRKSPSGRYTAKPSDNLLRVMVVPVHGAPPIEVAVRGSRVASELAKRSIAQREFLATGGDAKIERLRGTKILDASGNEVPFLTDLDELERQGDAGVLSFESLYARR
jgi:hypothetical protein